MGAAQGMRPTSNSPTTALSREEFAAAFEAERRVLICLAAAVLNSRTGAEDVVQEAAVVGLSKLADFEAGTHFGAWMGTIVRLVALNHARDRQRQRARAGEAPAAASAAPVDVGPRPFALELDDELMAALGALSETARSALLLRTVLELDYGSIARLLGIPEGTAMSHVHRSRESLRQTLLAAKEAARRNR